MVCLHGKTLFAVVEGKTDPTGKVKMLLQSFRLSDAAVNRGWAVKEMDAILETFPSTTKHVLLFDGDKTLIAEDTGAMFWETFLPEDHRATEVSLTTLFRDWGYTLNAPSGQARLWYNELKARKDFDIICETVASKIKIHPEFKTLIQEAEKREDTACLVLTCGIREIWELITQKEGLADKVLGAEPSFGGYVVDANVKGAQVDHVKTKRDVHVTAFGDSSLDLKMMKAADTAVVVVGKESVRSRTMEPRLAIAIDDGLEAAQVLLPMFGPDNRPRLNTKLLPMLLLDSASITAILDRRPLREITLTLFTPPSNTNRLLVHDLWDSSIATAILNDEPLQNTPMYNLGFTVLDASDRSSSKLLATPTRDANISGPALRQAHAAIGQYLANEFISSTIGLEEYPIPHVQGTTTIGHRLLHESATLIVPILRGGEPMAFGVSDAFPTAMFVHANNATDLKAHHVERKKNIILVDSVVNTDKSVVEFVERLKKLGSTAEHVVFVAGVVQAEAVAGDGLIAKMMNDAKGCGGKLSVVTLRLSQNKFTGKGTTDTGNRLFNTTHLD